MGIRNYESQPGLNKYLYMKKFTLIFYGLLITSVNLPAQNVGIGTGKPLSQLHVSGGLQVNAPYINPVNPPTPAQTHTMINATTSVMQGSDSVSRFYDPGGPSGNYPANVSCTIGVSSFGPSSSYLEALIENIQLGTGDSLIIYDGNPVENATILYRVGNGFSGSNIYINFSENFGYCIFKSNIDANVGAGFSILFTRRFMSPGTTDQPGVAGLGMAFYPKKAAFRAGILNASGIGEFSVAMGYKTVASGIGSTVFGYNSEATGDYSTALGYFAKSKGFLSVAAGANTLASGYCSSAMGYETIASGSYSTTLGLSTKAKSVYSLAIGRFNDTLTTENGSTWQATDRIFIIGDGTSDNARSSCFYILKNGNGWMQGTLTQASDARLKTNIIQLTDVLPKLLKLNGYHYYWKDQQNMPGLQAGLMAQEIQREMPELVTTNAEGQLAVNYSGLIPYLLEGLKEQDKKIAAQQAELQLLREEMRILKELVSKKIQP